MMKYTWSFNQKALKDFKKNLDKPVQRRIINWLDEHIEGTDNPRVWVRHYKGNLELYGGTELVVTASLLTFKTTFLLLLS